MNLAQYSEYVISSVCIDGLVHQRINSHIAEYAPMRF